MAPTESTLATAIRYHQQGNLQTAERLYREILSHNPRDSDALHLLGVIAHQVGNQQAAVDLLQQAIAINPNAPPFYCNLGSAYRALGRLEEAAQSYRRSLQLQADYAEAHGNLGVVLKEQGKLEEAIAAYRQALQLKPEQAAVHHNLAIALKRSGLFAEAIAHYKRAIELKPAYVDAHNNLGMVLREQGNYAEAIACHQRALQLKPDKPESHLGLGLVLKAQGRIGEAAACYERALAQRPEYAEAHSNLGNVLQSQGRLAEAVASYERALRYKSDSCETHNNLGVALQEQRQLEAALASYRRALELEPDYAEAHLNMGNVLEMLGQLDRAVASYQRALDARPDYTEALSQRVYQQLKMCDWRDWEENVTRVIEAAAGHDARIPPFLILALPATAAEQLEAARNWAAPFQRSGGSFQFAGRRNERIRLAYLSADFREHPVAQLAVELFERHDRDRFEVLGYSFGPDDGSALRHRLVDAFDRFIDVRPLGFEQAARQIHTDQVDILVDLTGYTTHARTQILSLRPAPLQVSFLGYPGTMGCDFIDYILVDHFVAPADRQPFFSEQLVHLPHCYLANPSRRPLADPGPSRSECGLPEDAFVFCCFNQGYKVTPQVFGVWTRLLQHVPGSVLWLPVSNSFAVTNLQREVAARGVSAERLVFASRTSLPEDHFARLGHADLFLDTWPYNAHATACDALWAGCPVITLPGETFASRVAGSLLTTLGMTDLIADSPQHYEQLAVELAQDSHRLANVRERLWQARATTALFKPEQFARNVERAFSEMWQRHEAGNPPRSFAVEPS